MSDNESGHTSEPDIPKWLQAHAHITEEDANKIRTENKRANSIWLQAQHHTLPMSSIRVLDRICEQINSTRSARELLWLDKGMNSTDKRDLGFALRKIGGTEDILSGDFPDELGEFQKHISYLLTLPPEHPESIESCMKQDDFDALATWNLHWFVDHHFDKFSSTHTQAILDKIIMHINSTRDSTEQLDPSHDFLSRRDQKDLLHARNKLGGTDEVFSDTLSLQTLQETIDRAFSLPPESPMSIEGLLSQDESEAIKFLEYLPRDSK